MRFMRPRAILLRSVSGNPDVLEDVLQGLGVEALEVDSAAEALDLLRHDGPIDLIIMERSPGNLLARKLVRVVERVSPHTRAVYIADRVPRELEGIVIESGSAVAIRKPGNRIELARAVERVLTAPSPRRSGASAGTR